jgi:CspA family cold shock protein
MATGKIKKIVVDRGFGFIASDDGKEYFFHHSAIRNASIDSLRGGEAVEFDTTQGPKGPRAENIRIVGTA